MKRVVAIALILAVVSTLFSFSVFATTYEPSTYNTYTDGITLNNLTYFVRVTQLKATSEGTSMLPGGMESIFLVTMTMTNNSDSTLAGTIPKATIKLRDDGSVITNVYTYGGEFTLGLLTGGTLIFYPNEEFSLDSNKVVVPPHQTLSFVGAIGLPAQLDQTGSSTLDNGLRGVSLYDKANYSVTSGNYSYGNPVDLSSVINYIDDLENIGNTSNSNLTTIINSIQTLIDSVTYNGGSYNPNNTNAQFVMNEDTTTVSGVSMIISRYIGASYYLNNDIEIDSGNDVIMSTGTRVVPVVYRMSYVNNTDQYLRLRYTNSINEFFPSGSYSYEITNIQSELFTGFISVGLPTSATNRRSHYYINNTVGDYGYIAPHSQELVVIFMNFYLNDSGSITFGNPTLRFTATPVLVSDIYHPNTVYGILRDLYLSLTKKADDDNTQEAEEMNEEIHDAEQVWYDNNSEALEQVGLSNYRFNNNQTSGIYQAVTQFQAVWNALGQWTNIYIFILILSISTYIIRHEPTTRVKQYRSSVQAERAERISYYGKKNAEARSSGSGSTLKNAIRRRK